MSTFEMEYVTCENCNTDYTFKFWEELDITDNPELREKILKDEIITSKCKICNHENLISYPFLCIDNKQKFLIWHLPVDDKELKENCKALNEDLLAEYNVTTDYQLRVTNDYNEVKDKIISRNENLDDRVIEILKEVYKSQIALDESEIGLEDIFGMYVNVSEDGAVVIDVVMSDERFMSLPIVREMYDKILGDAKKYFDNELKFQHISSEFAVKILRKIVKDYEREERKNKN